MENFLAENYASSLENDFFFHSMQYSFAIVRPGNRLPGKTLEKKPFLFHFFPSTTSKMSLCGNEQLC